MHQFQRQYLVDLGGVVPVSLEVAPCHGLEPLPFEVRSGKGSRVEQHLANVCGEGVPVPDPEMAELVPPEKQSLEAKGGKHMINPGEPLGHHVVVGIFRLG